MSKARKNNQQTWEAEGSKGHKVENADYVKFITRILRAMGKRSFVADPTTLEAMLALRAELDTAIDTAVVGMKTNGFSWADVASATGSTRQAACMRWGSKVRAADSTTIDASL